jgi:hypothetical protein
LKGKLLLKNFFGVIATLCFTLSNEALLAKSLLFANFYFLAHLLNRCDNSLAEMSECNEFPVKQN